MESSNIGKNNNNEYDLINIDNANPIYCVNH